MIIAIKAISYQIVVDLAVKKPVVDIMDIYIYLLILRYHGLIHPLSNTAPTPLPLLFPHPTNSFHYPLLCTHPISSVHHMLLYPHSTKIV